MKALSKVAVILRVLTNLIFAVLTLRRPYYAIGLKFYLKSTLFGIIRRFYVAFPTLVDIVAPPTESDNSIR
jgi:hypothetical protein